MSNLTDSIETQELIAKLRANGFGKMVDAMIENVELCYTKKARLNKSGTCRVLGWKTKELEDAFEECRKVIPEADPDA